MPLPKDAFVEQVAGSVSLSGIGAVDQYGADLKLHCVASVLPLTLPSVIAFRHTVMPAVCLSKQGSVQTGQHLRQNTGARVSAGPSR